MSSSFGNQTANTSAVWHPEPRGRGTFNILSSCLATMILCVWTAVHLNIPGSNEGTKQRVLRKFGWLLLALLAPEIVAWNAWEQRRIARKLRDDLVKALETGRSSPPNLHFLRLEQRPCLDPEQGSSSESHPRVTLTHGFYAAMGGYAIRSHSLDGQYPITSQGRLTLTKDGIQWLLKYAPEVFPDLTKAGILDKSKASTLVKTLTCLQALWFCLQCIVRLTMSTSISLLELNVFGHCICTFIIYTIWWNKPMDVAEPTFLSLEDRPELAGLIALLCSYTSLMVPRLPHPLSQCVETGAIYGRLARFNKSEPRNSQDGHQFVVPLNYNSTMATCFNEIHPYMCGSNGRFSHPRDTDKKLVHACGGLRMELLEHLLGLDASCPHIKVSMYENKSKTTITLMIGTEEKGLTYCLSRKKLEQTSFGSEGSEQPANKELTGEETHQMPRDFYRLERSYLTWLELASHAPNVFEVDYARERPPRPFVDRIHDWTFRLLPRFNAYWSTIPEGNVEQLFEEWGIFVRVPEWLALSAAAFIYGGLHSLAWNAPFHAPIYSLLWKISGITVASLSIIHPLALSVLLGWKRYDRRVNCPWLDKSGMGSKRSAYLCLAAASLAFFVMLLFALLYVLARVYLVVESFHSLAYLPESVLATPNFSLYFPHIG